MILFVWINKYKNLEKIGFNLTSKYNFNFLFEENDNIITGEIVSNPIKSSEIFNEYLWDLKAIIGKNGTGKSSLISSIIQSILTDYPGNFDGLIITEKYIFNRKGIRLRGKIQIDGKELIEIKNADICNYGRNPSQKKLTEEQAKTQKGYRIIDTYLKDHSIFYFSSLLNYDKVYESEEVVAGYQVHEVDFTKYFDLSTEAQIVFDWNSFSPFDYNDLKSGSEMLCHKSKESERILEYILSDENQLPFNIKIPKITIHLNQFSINFWDSISRQFKKDNELQAPLLRYIDSIKYSTKDKTNWVNFETALMKNFLFFALKYEVNYRYNFHSESNKGNAIIDTIATFERAAKNQKSLKGMLKNYFSKSLFYRKDYPDLFNQLNKLILFLKRASDQNKIEINNYSFDVLLSNTSFIKQFMKQSYRFYGFKESKKKYENLDLGFSIFSYEFEGLSSGEKSLLHLLSRFDHYFKRMDSIRKNIIIFIDEPEVGLHPQWQKQIISILTKFFKQKLKLEFKVQVIITGHSPIIISDLPRENVVFLDISKENQKPFVSKLTQTKNTFAANIHALYSDAFFIQEGTIGDFSKAQIQKVIEIVKTKNIEGKVFAQKIIPIIGDDLIRQRLEDMYQDAFELNIETLDDEISRLEQEIALAKSKKDENRK